MLTTDTDHPAEEVVRLYTGLAVIEAGWRELKSGLEVRPLRHRLDRRVEAHLVICVLASLLEKNLERELRGAGLSDDRGPWTGPRDIARFVNLTADEQVIGDRGPTRWVFTELDPTHRAILGAIGIEAERFQHGWGRLR